MGARVIRVNGKNYLSPGILLISLDGAEDLLEALRESVTQAQREFHSVVDKIVVEEAIDAKMNRPQFAGGSKVSMDGAYGKK